MNFECRIENRGYQLFQSLAEEFKLINGNECNLDKIKYTYRQETTGKYSCIDHIYMDKSIYARIMEYKSTENAINFSDHLPVTCHIDFKGLHVPAKEIVTKKYAKKAGVRRWDKANIPLYYALSGRLLQSINAPYDNLCCNCDIFKCNHWQSINEYYCSLVDALSDAAQSTIPVIGENCLKSYWNPELDELKQASIDAHNLWETCGKPNSGIIYDLRRDSKYKYKLAIRQAAELKDMDLDDEISQLYFAKDMNKFWKKWNSKFSKRNEIPHNINGRETDQDIADVFSNNFAQVCFNSYKDSDRVAKLWDSLHSKFLSEYDAIEGQLNTFHIDDIEASLKSLKNGKAGGLDGLTKEHIIHCHPAVIVHLKLLFNMMYIHGFVPDNFGVGVTVPIVKDKCGNITSADNYRPITISPVFSKLFEYCILHKFGEQLTSSDLQFGFKKHLSCAHAIFTLRQVTDFFVSHGSNMYMAALDAKKAFDRVNHIKLFELLIGKGLPARLVKLVVDWYGKTFQ